MCVCVCARTRLWASTHAQSCLTLPDPMDCSPLGSSNHGISRQEYWSGLPFLSPGDLPDLGSEPTSVEFAALKAESFAPRHLGSRCVLCVSCSVMSDSLWPHGLQPAKLLCPWDFPGKNTGVGCHFLLQRIFLTWGWTWVSCIRDRILYSLSHPGPREAHTAYKSLRWRKKGTTNVYFSGKHSQQ